MNSIQKACIKKNLKLTSQRKIIAEVICNSKDHPNIEKLYFRVSKIDSKISLATVYRTVNLFEQYGLIQKLEIGEGKARYEELKKANKHFHLVNINSGDIIEFQSKKLQTIKEEIVKKLGYKLVSSKMELYGIPIKNTKI